MTEVTVNVRETRIREIANVPRPTKLEVHFLDVPSDAALIRTPDGANVLVDCSSRIKDGEAVVRYLRAVGVTRLHALVASHQHSDHLRGFAAVFRAIQGESLEADQYVESGEDPGEPWYPTLMADYDAIPPARRPKRIPVRVSQSLLVPSRTAFYLYTDERYALAARDYRSLWLRVTHGAATVLLPGDNKRHQERHMLGAYPSKLRAHVFKASEHGSEHGSGADVLAAVRPAVVVISNVGHDDDPTPEKLKEFEGRRNAARRVYQTREDGRIVVRTTGRAGAGNVLRYDVGTSR